MVELAAIAAPLIGIYIELRRDHHDDDRGRRQPLFGFSRPHLNAA